MPAIFPFLSNISNSPTCDKTSRGRREKVSNKVGDIARNLLVDSSNLNEQVGQVGRGSYKTTEKQLKVYSRGHQQLRGVQPRQQRQGIQGHRAHLGVRLRLKVQVVPAQEDGNRKCYSYLSTFIQNNPIKLEHLRNDILRLEISSIV